MRYFKNKDTNVEHAKENEEYNNKNYLEQTAQSVEKSDIGFPNFNIQITPKFTDTKVVVKAGTSEQAALESYSHVQDKKCILNFASYKNPGGMYLQGSMAQEEALCHASNLYTILSSSKIRLAFYVPNQARLNNSLYGSNMVYTPDVIFHKASVVNKCDVITCAAPNKNSVVRYNRMDPDIVDKTMADRIDAVLNVAYSHNVTILVLGAFGCGVFGNDVVKTAETFNKLINAKYKGVFREVDFYIPDKTTFDTFNRIIEQK